VLRCRSCGARFGLSDYYSRNPSGAPTDEELEKRLANVPVNRL
jgi:hypothetical protein